MSDIKEELGVTLFQTAKDAIKGLPEISPEAISAVFAPTKPQNIKALADEFLKEYELYGDDMDPIIFNKLDQLGPMASLHLWTEVGGRKSEIEEMYSDCMKFMHRHIGHKVMKVFGVTP